MDKVKRKNKYKFEEEWWQKTIRDCKKKLERIKEGTWRNISAINHRAIGRMLLPNLRDGW